mmetsp:Transcript_9397/g.21741  ORF Transcript_9397/g.21741 Transcript_9397/m.21741 type:complete len:205 (+) Transcript_9397:1842-2456(+)
MVALLTSGTMSQKRSSPAAFARRSKARLMDAWRRGIWFRSTREKRLLRIASRLDTTPGTFSQLVGRSPKSSARMYICPPCSCGTNAHSPARFPLPLRKSSISSSEAPSSEMPPVGLLSNFRSSRVEYTNSTFKSFTLMRSDAIGSPLIGVVKSADLGVGLNVSLLGQCDRALGLCGSCPKFCDSSSRDVELDASASMPTAFLPV